VEVDHGRRLPFGLATWLATADAESTLAHVVAVFSWALIAAGV
jgi:hypothetical protein